MKAFLFGVVIGVILLPLLAFFYIKLGYMEVATAAPPLPFERKLAHMALDARISKEAPAQSPVPATESNLLAGAQLYREHCEVCHGSTSENKTAIAKGMFPVPPLLLHGKGVTDDPAGETYWKVANGIRLTGMPGFRGSLSDGQMWEISQLLATADKLPPSVTAALQQPPASK
ncbi:MAG: c-type cytochrome [Bryobacteraceae bacterium]